MTRTYSHDKFKKQDCRRGHCYYCGYNEKDSMARKTRKQKIMKFEIQPVIDLFLD